VEEASESILEITDEFSTEEEHKLIELCMLSYLRVTTLTTIWAMKEASRKAVGAEACSMKELILNKAEADGNYLVGELYHPKAGHIKSVAFTQANKYVYAVSISLDKKVSLD
jgi:phosphopantetheinyl transferase (holo-ACP synthase)